MVSVEQRIKEIIEEKLGVASNDYTGETRFYDDLGCDSLDKLDLILSIEKEFNINVPDKDFDTLKTVQGLIDYVKKHI